MEILGLVIVVALIIFATTLLVPLALKTSKDLRKGFQASQLASNMLNTFLKTSAPDCSQLTMTELLQDCAQSNAIRCIDGKDSCEFVTSAASTIFANTLEQWKKKYTFLAYTNINTPLIKLGETSLNVCTDISSETFQIPLSIGSLYTKLDICE